MTATAHIVLSRDDVAALMAAVADIEQYADGLAGFRPLDDETDHAVTELSRLASLIAGQVEAQT